jgi:hypothetical protein
MAIYIRSVRRNTSMLREFPAAKPITINDQTRRSAEMGPQGKTRSSNMPHLNGRAGVKATLDEYPRAVQQWLVAAFNDDPVIESSPVAARRSVWFDNNAPRAELPCFPNHDLSPWVRNATQADAYMGLIPNILSADGLIAPGGRLSRKGR